MHGVVLTDFLDTADLAQGLDYLIAMMTHQPQKRRFVALVTSRNKHAIIVLEKSQIAANPPMDWWAVNQIRRVIADEHQFIDIDVEEDEGSLYMFLRRDCLPLTYRLTETESTVEETPDRRFKGKVPSMKPLSKSFSHRR